MISIINFLILNGIFLQSVSKKTVNDVVSMAAMIIFPLLILIYVSKIILKAKKNISNRIEENKDNKKRMMELTEEELKYYKNLTKKRFEKSSKNISKEDIDLCNYEKYIDGIIDHETLKSRIADKINRY